MKFLTNHTLHIITLIFFLLGNSDAREAKEYDNDVNYEETKIRSEEHTSEGGSDGWSSDLVMVSS